MSDALEEDEPLEVVNERNEVIAILPRGEVHRRRLAHRACHIFLFNLEGELYLQKRSKLKRELPGYYDSSAAGHLRPRESYEQCALRELQEELSLSADLVRIGALAASELNAFEHVGLFVCRTGRTPVPNPAEIEQGEFYSLSAIEQWIGSGAKGLSPGFVHLFTLHRAHLSAFLDSAPAWPDP